MEYAFENIMEASVAEAPNKMALLLSGDLEYDFWLSRLCWARLSIQSYFHTALRCLYVSGGFSKYSGHHQCLYIP